MAILLIYVKSRKFSSIRKKFSKELLVAIFIFGRTSSSNYNYEVYL